MSYSLLKAVHTKDVSVAIEIAIVSVAAIVLRPSVNQYDVSATNLASMFVRGLF